MNNYPQTIKARFYSPGRSQTKKLKSSCFVGNQSSLSFEQIVQRENNKNSETIIKNAEERIKKGHQLCQNMKKKSSDLKNQDRNEETGFKFSHFRKKSNLSEEGQLYRSLEDLKLLKKITAPESTKQFLDLKAINETSQTATSPFQRSKSGQDAKGRHNSMDLLFLKPLRPSKVSTGKRDSPKKRESPIKRSEIPIKLGEEIQRIHEARQIESFIWEQSNDEMEISYVEEHGKGVLDWTICKGKASEFKIIKFLNEGRYGKVYLAQSYRNGAIYSIKTLYRNEMDADSLQQLIREVKIQSFVNHPNVVKLYNFFVDDDQAYLVLQPCLGKNLYQNLKQSGKMSQKVVKEYIRQICTAIEYMHNNDIIHRDLKPQNILLHENSIKICDFGWAIHSPLLRATQCGTPIYTSPEIVNRQPYDSKIDIWSIGVLTYELLYGTIPFEIRHIDDLIKITQQEVYFSHDIVVSKSAKDFMKGCLCKNPLKRYAIRQLIEHQFLYKLDKYRQTFS